MCVHRYRGARQIDRQTQRERAESRARIIPPVATDTTCRTAFINDLWNNHRLSHTLRSCH